MCKSERQIGVTMATMSTESEIRVGADVASVQSVIESVEQFGDRYLQRIFTQHELSSCAGPKATRASSLAARFAAKEATFKVLRPKGHQPEWRSVEVRREEGGWCSIALTGYAAALASEAHIAQLAVSLTHDRDVAAAVVVAVCQDNRPPTGHADPSAGGAV